MINIPVVPRTSQDVRMSVLKPEMSQVNWASWSSYVNSTFSDIKIVNLIYFIYFLVTGTLRYNPYTPNLTHFKYRIQ